MLFCSTLDGRFTTLPAAVGAAGLGELLFVDTFAGKAYLGVVPFFMTSVRYAAWLIALRLFSSVRSAAGRRSVPPYWVPTAVAS